MAFDETIDESGSGSRKVNRLDLDPFSSQLGMRRFPSENMDTITSLQKDNADLKSKTQELEAELAVSKAKVASTESKVKNLELERDRQAVEREREKGGWERDMQDARERCETLKCKVKVYRQRENDRMEDRSRSRELSLDRTAELEAKVSSLRAEKENLEEKLLEATLSLSRRPDIDKLKYNEEKQEFKSRLSELENKENVYQSEMLRMEQKKKQTEELLLENDKLQGQLRLEKLRADKLDGELEANRDAVLQRLCMRDKLEKYHELEAENSSLRSRNKLLVETAANR